MCLLSPAALADLPTVADETHEIKWNLMHQLFPKKKQLHVFQVRSPPDDKPVRTCARG